MAPTIPTTEPTVITAGETSKWTISPAEFPTSESWTLEYLFRGAGANLDVEAEPQDGGGYLVTLPAEKTANLSAGTYQWTCRATKDGEVFPVRSGVLEVRADPADQEDGDAETHAAKGLRLIESAIEGRITADHEAYTIGPRSITKIPIAELVRLRSVYAAKVWRERNPGKLGVPVLVQFTR